MFSSTLRISDTDDHPFTFKKIPIRFIRFSTLQNKGCIVKYGINEVGYFTKGKDLSINFESYHGFPDASLFNVKQDEDGDLYVNILADSVPEMPISPDYFTNLSPLETYES